MVNDRLKNKYQIGNLKYFIINSSTNWTIIKHKAKIIIVMLLLKIKISPLHKDGIIDQHMMNVLILLVIKFSWESLRIIPQYTAPKNVRIIEP